MRCSDGISRGEAHSINAWHPDRLTRNVVDGGQIIHFLDVEKIFDLRFPTFTFENSPQGKFMLMIMSGLQSMKWHPERAREAGQPYEARAQMASRPAALGIPQHPV
jgi:site-specific DNA recombinase